MIIFHEGLPRSGKSYEAVVKHIIPALASGRKVFARINGLNYEKLAELAGITVERCRELLIHIEESQVLDVYRHIDQDSLLVLDELQNFFPNQRKPLDPKMMRFIAEHGHYGLDILILGQSFNDIHSVWRRRTERKVMFLKLSAVGKDNSYNWTAYQAIPQNDRDPKWNKAANGIEKYDSKFFGSYASHVPSVDNKGAYADGRFNIFNRKSLRYGLPALLLFGCYGIYYISNFFSDESPITKPKPTSPSSSSAPAPASQAAPVSGAAPSLPPSAPPVPAVPKSVSEDWIYQSFQKHDVALTYLQRVDNRILDLLVEVRDDDLTTLESWTMEDFIRQGWSLKYHTFGVELKKAGYKILVREKPYQALANTTPVVGIKQPL
ncbi:TPA: zonular occludens toxin domain-containing protein [Vibrio cholerae]